MVSRIIIAIETNDQLANYIPEWVYQLCHEAYVFFRDTKTGELVQVLDLREKEKETKKNVC